MAYAQQINDAFPPEVTRSFFDYAKTFKLPQELRPILDEVDGKPLMAIIFPHLMKAWLKPVRQTSAT